MSATVEIRGHRATISSGAWSCEDLALLEALNALYPGSFLPDEVNAREAIEKLGGTLIAQELSPEETPDHEGRITIH